MRAANLTSPRRCRRGVAARCADEVYGGMTALKEYFITIMFGLENLFGQGLEHMYSSRFGCLLILLMALPASIIALYRYGMPGLNNSHRFQLLVRTSHTHNRHW